ncbi:hypothetical protein Bhyg_09497 [Pseudolycoriella hygida]|uniref:Uncharacterized protein n=1 Tax=Pseudolycoriella hygida TaxID=35572 RepID=A0A9Q0N6L2_9DIPT|nr:hypothetical protein Bhyg_09497 [Pseudolycoriella hygida]
MKFIACALFVIICMVQSNESTSPKLSPDQNACDASGGQQACFELFDSTSWIYLQR